MGLIMNCDVCAINYISPTPLFLSSDPRLHGIATMSVFSGSFLCLILISSLCSLSVSFKGPMFNEAVSLLGR